MTKIQNNFPKKITLIFILFSSLFTSCKKNIFPFDTEEKIEKAKTLSKIEFPKREFRAAWIATVDNIDWPSKKGLSSEIQQQDFRKILDFHKNIGINAVMVQVRAAADAFYAKSTEPWSEWLMASKEKPPNRIMTQCDL